MADDARLPFEKTHGAAANLIDGRTIVASELDGERRSFRHDTRMSSSRYERAVRHFGQIVAECGASREVTIDSSL